MKIEPVIIFKDGRLEESDWVQKPYRDIPVDEQTWMTKTGLTVFHGEYRFMAAAEFIRDWFEKEIAELEDKKRIANNAFKNGGGFQTVRDSDQLNRLFEVCSAPNNARYRLENKLSWLEWREKVSLNQHQKPVRRD